LVSRILLFALLIKYVRSQEEDEEEEEEKKKKKKKKKKIPLYAYRDI